MSFVTRNLRKVQAGKGVNAPGSPEIPSAVFEELLVNALVHRDYLVSAPIRLFLFADRIEIISPGHLPNNLTVAKIRVGNSNIRNPILVSFAAKGLLPYRGLGSGITRALESWPAIDFQDDRDGCLFTATIRREPGGAVLGGSSHLPRGSQKVTGLGIFPEESSQKSSQKIMDLLRANPEITISELATALSLTDRAIKKQLGKLKSSGQVLRVGPDKGGHWKVVK